MAAVELVFVAMSSQKEGLVLPVEDPPVHAAGTSVWCKYVACHGRRTEAQNEIFRYILVEELSTK